MIKTSLEPYFRVKLLTRVVGVLLFGWTITASVWAYVNRRPQVLLIGLDDTGTRVITSVADPVVVRERVAFVREFLQKYYNFDSASYSEHISQMGGFMSDALWAEKRPDFEKSIAQMKSRPLTQDARLIDLREVSEKEFEADIEVHLKSRLAERTVRFRITVVIAPRKRSVENPYPLEVAGINEIELD